MALSKHSSRQIRPSINISASAVAAALLATTLALPASASYRDPEVYRAEVLTVDPLFETVEVSEPRELCRDERVQVRSEPRYDDRYSRRQSNGYRSRTPGVVGAILGGAIGHSVGNGKTNKRIGTAVGAILGGTIGADISRRNQRRNAEDQRWESRQGFEPVSYRTERVCTVVADTRFEQRVRGYDVAYAYGGETYTTVLDYDPGRYLDVRVRVTPVD